MIRPVQVSFRNISRSEAIEAMIRDEASHLDNYYNHITGCRVMIQIPHKHRARGKQFHVMVYVTVPGGEIVVNREPSLHSRQLHIEEEDLTREREIEPLRKHLQVAIREAFDITKRQLQDYARRQRSDVKTHEPKPSGRVSRLQPSRGHGYIESLDGRVIYFHRNSVLSDDFDNLRVGSAVSFVEEEGERGPQASSVSLIRGWRNPESGKEAQA